MQNPELVKKLLAELKTCTTNDFELHRVEVLEKDLLEGLPVVEVIDDTHQKFNGVIYSATPSTRNYFKNSTSSSIYYNVWQYFYGEIPAEGFEIHHKDHNPANNDISNLMLLTKEEHREIHRYNKRGVKHQRKKFICIECGKEYEASLTGGHGNKFCSTKCRTRQYLRLKGHKPQEGKTVGICQICGKEFEYYPKAQTGKYCSQKCAHAATKKFKKCAWCGKSFHSDDSRTKCCSLSCAGFLREKQKRDIKHLARV